MLARASELDRLLVCPGPRLLPRDEDVPGYIKPANAARAAQWGVMAHYWKETGRYPDNIAYAKPLERKIKACGIDRLKQWPEEGEHEVALAYNVVTRKAVRCKVPTGSAADYKDNWKRGFDDEWITGTLDYVTELVGVPWVDDLKTGRDVSYHTYEAQQAFYVLAYTLATYKEVRESRSTLTHWPRYPTAVGPRRFGTVFDLDYLTEFQRRLERLRDGIMRSRNDGTMKLAVGDHCRFCPSKGFCPKMTAVDTTKDETNE